MPVHAGFVSKAETDDGVHAGAQHRKLFTALFCAGFATFAQLYAPQALVAQLIPALNITVGQAGLVVSMGTIGLAAGVIGWVVAANRLGPVRAMRIAIMAGGLFTLFTALAPSYAALLSLRFVAGFAIAGIPVLALAYLNTSLTPGRAARTAGIYIAGNSLGGLAGRLMAGLVAPEFGWQAGLLAVCGLAAVGSLGFLVLMPKEIKRPVTVGPTMPGLKENLSNLSQLKIFTQGFLIMGAFVTIYNYMGLRLMGHPFGLPATITAAIFVVYLFGTFASVQTGALAVRWGRARTMVGAGLMVLAGIVITLIPHLTAQITGLVLATMGFFAGQAVASGWASLNVPGARIQAGALYTLAYYGGGSLMGWVGGILFGVFGWLGTAGLVAALALASTILALTQAERPGRMSN